eukprot:79988-Pelagomonas_calceolata.AAC.5
MSNGCNTPPQATCHDNQPVDELSVVQYLHTFRRHQRGVEVCLVCAFGTILNRSSGEGAPHVRVAIRGEEGTTLASCTIRWLGDKVQFSVQAKLGPKSSPLQPSDPKKL